MVMAARLGHYLGAMGLLQRIGLLGRTLFVGTAATRIAWTAARVDRGGRTNNHKGSA